MAYGHVELRNCDVSVSGSPVYGAAAAQGGDLLVLDSRITATAGGTASPRVWGISTDDQTTKVSVRNTIVSVNGGAGQSAGVASEYGGTFELANSEVEVVPGPAAWAVVGPTYAGFAGTMSIAHSKVSGPLRTVTSPLRCLGVYDANYAPATCP